MVLSLQSNWISATFDNNKPDEMIDANNPRMEPSRAKVQRMNYICTQEKFVTKNWLKEYAPRTPSDLVLQKPKLDQLNAWLQRASTWVGMVRSCSVHLFYFFK